MSNNFFKILHLLADLFKGLSLLRAFSLKTRQKVEGQAAQRRTYPYQNTAHNL